MSFDSMRGYKSTIKDNHKFVRGRSVMGKYFLAWQAGGCTGIGSDYYLIAQDFG